MILTVMTVIAMCILYWSLYNLWNEAYKESQRFGGWRRLPRFVWVELIVATPFLIWLLVLGSSRVIG